MKWIGSRGKAFFDAWTIVHLAFWLVMGANFQQLGLFPWWRWSIIIIGAFLWECIEVALDTLTKMEMTHEGSLNRWVSDPLMAVIGSAAGMYLIAS